MLNVKGLVGNNNGKVENWRNIAEWLEDAGYKRDVSIEYDASDSISFIVVKKANIKIEKNQEGKPIAVIVPIDLWKEIESERETAYLLKSETMKQRLLAAKNRQTGMSLEEVCEKLRI